MSIRKRFRRLKLRYGRGYSKRYSNQQQFFRKAKRHKRVRRNTKIFGFSVPVIAGVAAIFWYFFLRKKAE